MKSVLLNMFVCVGVMSLLSACGTRGNQYGGFLNGQLGQTRSYEFSENTRDLSGPSNRHLSAAEYRSDIQADTAENIARAQHAELGVVDHKLDTQRRAQYYDHRAHMEGNLENRDDFNTIEDITGSVSGTGANIKNALDNFQNIFK